MFLDIFLKSFYCVPQQDIELGIRDSDDDETDIVYQILKKTIGDWKKINAGRKSITHGDGNWDFGWLIFKLGL